MTTKQQEKEKEEFLFPAPLINKESNLTFLEVTTINNLNNFSQHVSYLTNLAIGGKITAEEAYKEIKKLYRAMKKSHKSLKGSWF